MQNVKIPDFLMIKPKHMIHELGLKGCDLLVYAFIYSVYNLTAKAVNVNKTYLSMITNYSRRQVINSIENMINCGVLVKYGESFVPAAFMCKGHSVKKVHSSVKKVHNNKEIIFKDNISKECKKESLKKKEYLDYLNELTEIARTPWLED